MQFLKVVAVMTVVASFLPVVTATPPSTRKYDANSKPISSLSDKFTLTVLTPDSKGKINLKVSNPVILKSYWLFSEVLVSLPRVGLANLGAQTFSLKNKKLSAEGSEASLLPVKYEISFLGLRSFLFDPDERAGPYDSINFTAVHTTDSYGRRFLRLGAGDGENKFIVGGAAGLQIFYKPDTYEGYPDDLNITIALHFPD